MNHPQDKLIPFYTYVIGAVNSHSLSGIFFVFSSFKGMVAHCVKTLSYGSEGWRFELQLLYIAADGPLSEAHNPVCSRGNMIWLTLRSDPCLVTWSWDMQRIKNFTVQYHMYVTNKGWTYSACDSESCVFMIRRLRLSHRKEILLHDFNSITV